jgi:hypothetical protein
MCSPWVRAVDKYPSDTVDREALIVRNPGTDRRLGEQVDNRCETALGCSGLQFLAREGSGWVTHIFTALTTTTGIPIYL